VAPTANFLASPTTGEAPLTVQFFDVSTPGSAAITAWQWNFGNGATSTAASPEATYATPGSYDVSLTVTTDAGSHTRTLAGVISVLETTPECEGEEEGEEEGEGEGAGEGEPEGALEGETQDPPLVVSTAPADGADNVPAEARVRVLFDRALLSSSVTANSIALQPATPGVTTYGAGVLTFTPADDLLKGTLYKATVSADIASLDGFELGAPYTFTFTTVPEETTLPLDVNVSETVFVPGTPIVALASFESSSVLFVDTEQMLLIEEQVLTNPPQSMTLVGDSLYVADRMGTVFEFDADTGSLVRFFAIATQPYDIAIDAAGRLFVSEYRNDFGTGVDSYDLATGDFLGTAGIREVRHLLSLTDVPNEVWGFYPHGSPQRIYRFSVSGAGEPQEVNEFYQENFWRPASWMKFDPTGSYLLLNTGDRMNVQRGAAVSLAPGLKIADRLFDVLFDEDLQLVITTEPDGVYAYDSATFQEVGTIAFAEPESAALGWNAAGDTLLVVHREENAPTDEILYYPLELLLGE
jgi:PKD repeat protein